MTSLHAFLDSCHALIQLDNCTVCTYVLDYTRRNITCFLPFRRWFQQQSFDYMVQYTTQLSYIYVSGGLTCDSPYGG
jgi:hypothetical protein